MSPEVIASIDAIKVNMNVGGMNVINIVLAFVMFGVALGIKPETFLDVIKKPKSFILGIICQMILLPGLTFLLALAMKDMISPMIGLGMILVASCPGGNISNFITSLSRGNTELSVSLTAVNTGVCIFTTPANFALWGGLFLNNAQIASELPQLSIPFWEIFKTIVILLGIPIILGVLCRKYLPAVSEKIKKPLQYLSIVFFIVMVVLAFSNNLDAFMKCIRYIFLIVLIHNVLALGIGFLTGSAFKVPYKDRRTLTIETGIQNSGLGLVLLFNPAIFGPEWAANGGMLVITAWWGVWHIISGLTLAFLWRWRGRKDVENA